MVRPLLLEVPQLSNACRRRVEMSDDARRLAYGPCTRAARAEIGLPPSVTMSPQL